MVKPLRLEEINSIYQQLSLEGTKVIRMDYSRYVRWYLVVLNPEWNVELHYGNIPLGELEN